MLVIFQDWMELRKVERKGPNCLFGFPRIFTLRFSDSVVKSVQSSIAHDVHDSAVFIERRKVTDLFRPLSSDIPMGRLRE